MSVTQGILLGAVAVMFVVGRAYHYKTLFGYWAWGRLRPEDAARLLPNDSKAAYRRGLREGGVEARDTCLREVLDALDHAYHPQNPTNEHPVDFIERHFGIKRDPGWSAGRHPDGPT